MLFLLQKRSVSCTSFGRPRLQNVNHTQRNRALVFNTRFIGRNSVVLGVRDYSQETGGSDAGTIIIAE